MNNEKVTAHVEGDRETGLASCFPVIHPNTVDY